ncbi:arylsulfatase [Gelidibacter gilvus]|uniref:N-acetylgalactosamine-6-sulfatase n=1 Tax=Gelidibacter gilvus TaxID=59602 RepID=A0A4Q0XFD1_9FLAO|nr:arylsulfatase [Gelidibacter gilvus]RXJ49930.1 N-acetylgalactosamine-6-sulfatase [Gelidibacter gilvus]
MKLIQILTSFILIVSLSSCQDKKANDSAKTEVHQKPNIIYILADDLGYGDLGVYGQTKIETPNIDALAKEGLLFTQHYSASPVCAPARASLLTGLHGGHASIRGNDEWEERGNVWNYRAMIADSTLEGQRPMPKKSVTIAQLLKKADYKTAIVGKWGLGAPQTESIPTRMGFDYFFGYNCQRQAHTYTPVHLYENENRVYLNNDTIAPHEGLAKGSDAFSLESYAKYTQPDYSPSLIFDKMMGFIDENKKDPFFVYWASPIPHVPLQAPQKWIDYYVKKFGDEKPHHFIEDKGADYFPTRYPHATYAAMISYLDENVGKLVAYLKEEGLYENTLIVFTSDNGPSSAGGGDAVWFDSAAPFDSSDGRGKGFLYEGGIRVPMIATWPAKIKAGSKTDHISAFYDVMPTLNEIANVQTDYKSDGISFYNTLTNTEKQKEHEYLYWEFAGYNGQVAVRMGKWKMIWKNIKDGNKNVELYDLNADIREEHNIMDQHPEMLEKFFEIVKKEHHTPENASFVIDGVEAIFE